jgi:hypothetical protein
MTLKKMRWKEGQPLHVLDIPDNCRSLFTESYSTEWPEEEGVLLLVFVRSANELKEKMDKLSGTPEGSSCWIAYPKKSSVIHSDLSREVIWGILTTAGLAPVSQIAIDADWSALRYRPSAEVKRTAATSLDVPELMLNVLKQDAEASEFFYSLSATNRKEYIGWINSAKREETRKKRLEELIPRLKEGLKNPSEKFQP